MKKKKRTAVKSMLAILLVLFLLGNSAALADEASWTTLAPMSVERNDFFKTEVIDGKIYAIGGYTDDGITSSVEVYNPDTDTWTTLSSMSCGRREFQTQVIDGKIYALGGYNTSDQHLSSAEVYDPDTNTWTTLSAMSTARMNFQTEVIDGKLYVIGGFNGSSVFSSAEVYDPDTDIWTTLSSMSYERRIFSTEVIDGKIYAIGGLLRVAMYYHPLKFMTLTRIHGQHCHLCRLRELNFKQK